MAAAVCTVIGATVLGTIHFVPQDDGAIHVMGSVAGLTPGLHGFHIHQYGDIRQRCKAAGGHFNPGNATHGAPEDAVRHVGDLGNIMADEKGVARVDITDTVISFSGDSNIIGRSIVIHGGVDDLGKGGNEGSKKTGNAGPRVGCGVIGISAPPPTQTEQSSS